LDGFEVWLKVQRSRISAKSRLGEKLSYIAKYTGYLKLFLDDGSVEMDSNIVECAVRRAMTKVAEHGPASRLLSRPAS
jgi:transposase